MAQPLRERVRQDRFDDLQQEAFVALLVAAGHIRQALNETCATYGITHDQYNVLRILRGVYPEGHPRYEIIDRLIERSPDVTRLIDRLEREGLVERYRSKEDRRLSIARITKKGLALLDEMEDDIRAVRLRYVEGLDQSELTALVSICGAMIR